MKRKRKRKHLESTYSPELAKMSRGISKLHEYDPLSGYSWKYSALVPEARDGSSESEYFSCDSSFYNPSCAEILGSDEETLLSGPFGFVQGHSQRAEDSHSEYISCASSLDKLVHDDMRIHQLYQVVSCFESPEMPLSQDLEQWETSSPFPQVSFPFHLVNSNESFVSSVHMQEKRFMKIYYMHVQLERGVAISWNTGEGLKPSSKKIRIEEMTCPEKVATAFIFCHVSTKELLTDTEFISDSKAQEEREKESPAEPPALEECSRAKTPEWLVALDTGFRCMGCCRVFPSLEVLQEHVERGINEGFSCHAFHLALAWFKSKGNRKGKKKRRKKKKIKKATSGCHEEKHFGMKISSYK
ncbi:protein FAM170A-like isoform X2 [Vicugna pacos]|uniref:Protein FAM170A-like isoform X2 n=1 Tax=Vicugna pacos TaxID=30538 RepID=A0ABM5CZ85_VICPA